MRRRRDLAVAMFRIVLPVAILLGGVTGFFMLSAMKQEPARAADDKTPTVVINGITVKIQAVETEEIRRHDAGIDIQVSGLVVPYREITMTAEVAGRIESKAEICRGGRYVERGAELMQIDRRDYELAMNEASAALDELRAEIGSTEALLQIAASQLALEKRDYEREQKLRDVVSDADLDQAERELLASENALVTLRHQLTTLETRERRLEVSLKKAQLDLDRTRITAPVSGMIVSDLVEQDTFVQRGAPLVVLEDTSRVEVKCNLRKEDLQWLWLSDVERLGERHDDPASVYEVPRAEALVRYDSVGTTCQWRGKLARYDGFGLDSKTRTIPCRVVVEDPHRGDRVLLPSTSQTSAAPALVRGMYVTVQIRANPQTALWRIPAAALRPGRLIWLVREGRLVKQPVREAQTLDDEVIIHLVNGLLTNEDRVVVSPLTYPYDGLPVREATEP